MSQVHVPTSSVPDVLQLSAIANGTTTDSGTYYQLEVSDDTIWQTNVTRGTNIAVHATGDYIVLKAGLYQINFSGWIQNGGTIYGSSDTIIEISSNATFIPVDILQERNIMYYGESGASSLVTGVYDFNHSVLVNAGSEVNIYIRVKNTNGAGEQYFLRGDASNNISLLEVLRLSEAVS